MDMHARNTWAPIALAVALAAPAGAAAQTTARPPTSRHAQDRTGTETAVVRSLMSAAAEAVPLEEWGQPGAYHHALARMVGTWDVRITMHPQDGHEEILHALAVIQPTLDEHYVEENLTVSDRTDPFRAHAVTGYDSVRDRVESIWFDNRSLAVRSFVGFLTLPGDEFVVHEASLGTDDVAEAARATGDVRVVTRFLSDDEFVVTEYGRVGGRERKIAERLYTRK